MKIHDISMTISHDMPVYKGKMNKRPEISKDLVNSSGSVYESRLVINLHTGTHLDAPLHIIPGGESIDTIPLDRIVTRCKVIDMQKVIDRITAEDLAELNLSDCDFVLFKTQNSFDDILEGEFIYIDASAACFLKKHGIRGVGIDGLGVERAQPKHETHEAFFKNDIIVLEGLRLARIDPGEYLLIALPLKLISTEAAPVRAILVEE